jgi:hypothetical protein
MHGDQHSVRIIRWPVDQTDKIERSFVDRLCDRLERADFCRRQTCTREPDRSRAPHRGRLERIQLRGEPRPDGSRACSGKLLRDDNSGEPGESARAPAQHRPSGDGKYAGKARIVRNQRRDASLNIVVSAKEERHAYRTTLIGAAK